jgi:hypothetical protein
MASGPATPAPGTPGAAAGPTPANAAGTTQAVPSTAPTTAAANPAATATTQPTTQPPTQPPRPRPSCSVIARNDLSACAAVGQRFGATDGDACTASARLREAQCNAGGEVTVPLAVRYF